MSPLGAAPCTLPLRLPMRRATRATSLLGEYASDGRASSRRKRGHRRGSGVGVTDAWRSWVDRGRRGFCRDSREGFWKSGTWRWQGKNLSLDWDNVDRSFVPSIHGRARVLDSGGYHVESPTALASILNLGRMRSCVGCFASCTALAVPIVSVRLGSSLPPRCVRQERFLWRLMGCCEPPGYIGTSRQFMTVVDAFFVRGWLVVI